MHIAYSKEFGNGRHGPRRKLALDERKDVVKQRFCDEMIMVVDMSRAASRSAGTRAVGWVIFATYFLSPLPGQFLVPWRSVITNIGFKN